MPNEQNQIHHQHQTQQTQNTKHNKLNGFIGIVLLLLFDIALPAIIAVILGKYMSSTYAMIISSVPTFLVVVYGLISKMIIDSTAMMTVIGLNVSAVASLLGNESEPQIQLILNSAVFGIIGILFLITLIPIKIGSFQLRPMSFYFAKDVASGGAFGFAGPSELTGLTEDEPIADRWDRHWDSFIIFRRTYIILTSVWGVGLLIQVPIRFILIQHVQPFERVTFISNIITYVSIASLVLFNPIYIKLVSRRSRKLATKAGVDIESALR